MKNRFFLLLGFIASVMPAFSQTVTDIDGNVYNTVDIATQVWMKENLKTKHYQNGTAIPLVTDAFEWGTINSPAYCNYNNDEGLAAVYGRLYNWYAVNDANKLCPAGWHVPSHNEWTILERAICTTSNCETEFPFDIAGGWTGSDEGNKLKEPGEAHWLAGNEGTNSSGFTALPGGYRNNYDFSWMGYEGWWWTSTENPFKDKSAGWAFSRSLLYAESMINREDQTFMRRGFSVRCVRDIPAGVSQLPQKKNFSIFPSPSQGMVSIELSSVCP